MTGKAGASEPAKVNVTFKAGVGTDAGIGDSGASITQDNKANVILNLKAPAWVADGTGNVASLKMNVLVNGNVFGEIALTNKDVVGGIIKASDTSVTNIPTGAKVEVVITELTYKQVKIQYLDAKGADITSKMVSGTTLSSAEATVASGSITIKYPTSDSAHAPTVSIVSGLKAGTAGALTYTSGTKTYNGTISSAEALGTEPVVIKIDDSAVVPSYALTLGDNVKAAATALSSYGISTTADSAKAVAVALGANSTSLTKDDVCSVTLTLSAALTDAYKYKVELALDNGTTVEAAVSGTSVVLPVSGLTADTKITAMTFLVAEENLTATVALNDAKNILTVTFSEAVDAATVTLDNLGIAAAQVNGSDLTKVTGPVMSSGDTVATVTCVDGEAFADAATITLKNAIKAASDASKALVPPAAFTVPS